MAWVSQGLGPSPGAGATVTQVISTVDVEIVTEPVTIEMVTEPVTVEIITDPILLTED